MVERGPEEPGVVSSILTLGTITDAFWVTGMHQCPKKKPWKPVWFQGFDFYTLCLNHLECMGRKVGRNDPCPCGRHKPDGNSLKYKHCCLDDPKPPIQLLQEAEKKHKEATRREHEAFRAAHAQGICYLCDQPYTVFNSDQPCRHWFLHPLGVRKKDLGGLLEHFGCFRIQDYLRWVANAEVFAQNINDLAGEGDSSKLIDVTIVYRNLEWAFSCSKNDFSGHPGGQHSLPHFHFQMRIDGRPFINYSDFHPKFTEEDLFLLKVMREEVSWLRYRNGHGAGMDEVMNVMSAVDNPLEGMKRSDDPDKAQFHVQTLVEADPGTQISGDEIADIMAESKRTGVPIAKLLSRLKNARVTTIIEPGESIPDKASRTTRKSR